MNNSLSTAPSQYLLDLTPESAQLIRLANGASCRARPLGAIRQFKEPALPLKRLPPAVSFFHIPQYPHMVQLKRDPRPGPAAPPPAALSPPTTPVLPAPEPTAPPRAAERGNHPDDLFTDLLGRYSGLAASAFMPPAVTKYLPLPTLLQPAFPAALDKAVRNHVAAYMLEYPAIRRCVVNPLFPQDGSVFMTYVMRPVRDNLIAHVWRQAWSNPELLSKISADLPLDNAPALAVIAGLVDMPVPAICQSLHLLTLILNQVAEESLSYGFLFKFLDRFAAKDIDPPVADLSILAALVRSSHPAPQWLLGFLEKRPARRFPLLTAYQNDLRQGKRALP